MHDLTSTSEVLLEQMSSAEFSSTTGGDDSPAQASTSQLPSVISIIFVLSALPPSNHQAAIQSLFDVRPPSHCPIAPSDSLARRSSHQEVVSYSETTDCTIKRSSDSTTCPPKDTQKPHHSSPPPPRQRTTPPTWGNRGTDEVTRRGRTSSRSRKWRGGCQVAQEGDTNLKGAQRWWSGSWRTEQRHGTARGDSCRGHGRKFPS